MAIDFSGADAQSQALSDAILKPTAMQPLKIGVAGPKWSQPGDTAGVAALYKQFLSGAMPPMMPNSIGHPTSLMDQQGRMHDPDARPGHRRSQAFQNAINQMNKTQGFRDPQTLTGAAGTAAIAGYQGYNQANRPDATPADQAAGTAGAISGAASGASALLPGWSGKIAQLASLMAGEYGKNQANYARGGRAKTILANPDAAARAAALDNQGDL